MNGYELSFAKINIIQADIAEVIINEGVEVNVEMVNEARRYLLDNMTIPYSLLINRLHSYTYSTDAKLEASNMIEISSVAIVSYDSIMGIALKSMVLIFIKSKWSIKFFGNRELAISWLGLSAEGKV